MINYFKKKFTDNTENLDNKESLDNKKSKSSSSGYVDIKLALNELEEIVTSDCKKDILKEDLDKLPPIKHGQVNISGIYAYDVGHAVEVNLYIRNGLNKKVNFNEMPLKIVNSQGEVLAEQNFDLRELGNVPPHSAKPYKVYFDKKNIYVDTIPEDNWKIVFNSKITAERTVDFQLENIPPVYQIELIEEFMRNLPRATYGTVNVNLYKIEERANEELVVTVLVRNGN